MIQSNFVSPQIHLLSLLYFLLFRYSFLQPAILWPFLQSIWQHINVADLELLKGFMVVKYRVWIWRAHLHILTSLAFAIQAKLSRWQFQSTAFYSCFEKTIFKQNSKQIRNNNTQKQKDNLEEYWTITVPI